MTLKQALQVKLPGGKPLGVATLSDIAEFGKLVADLMIRPEKLEAAADDDPIWEQAMENAEKLEEHREVQDAIFTLWRYGYVPPRDEGATVQ